MKNYLALLCLIGGTTALAQEKQPGWGAPPPANPPQKGVTTQTLPEKALLKQGYIQLQVHELNPTIDVFLLIHEGDLSLQLAILNTSSGKTHFRSSPSGEISVSPLANIIAVTTNMDRPGHLNPDGPTAFGEVEVMDETGKTLFIDRNTGTVHSFLLDPAGNLFLNCDKGMSMRTTSGHVKWSKPFLNARFDWVSGYEYITAESFSLSTDTRHTQVIDAATGNVVHSVSTQDMEVAVVAWASRSRQEVVIARYNESVANSFWTMERVLLPQGQVISSVQGVKGRPFFMRYNILSHKYEMTLWMQEAPQQRGASMLHYATWAPAENSISEKTLGNFAIQLPTAGLFNEAVQESYTIKVGNQLITVQP